MNVLHICLSNFFVDDRAYQENELVAEHRHQGHNVLVLASTETHSAEGGYEYLKPGQYMTREGARVIRLPYHPWVPGRLAPKLRIHRGVYRLIEEFKPDSILFHGIAGRELLTVARYKKRHPATLLYADTHADFVNSARTFLSRWVLYHLYYRPIVQLALPQLGKILCISLLTQDFARKVFGVPEDKLEFYPLGGHPVQEPDYTQRRKETQAELDVSEKEILFVQSGKQTALKRLPEFLRAFAKVLDPRFKFLVSGVLMGDIRAEAEKLIAADSRVKFIGWLPPEKLEDILCAADVYVQPGSQSSTMQTSLCCHCAVLLQDWESHRVFVKGNGWLIAADTDIQEVLEQISENRVDLGEMQEKSKELADQLLDYSVHAKRILTDSKS